MEKLTIAISGMSCAHCVGRVRKTLEAMPGVHASDVSIGAASLSYDPAATTPAQIAAAVSDAGYPAQPTSGGAAR
jgi:copper chaperone CopZ